MGMRVVIDLDKCDQCDSCGVRCAYLYRPHTNDQGVLALRVLACPFDALERQPDGVLKRHNLRCVSCKLCAHACPFGTIYPDMVPFYVTPCDYCLGQHGGKPPCAGSCSRGAVDFREVDGDDPAVHVIDEYLAARSRKWLKREEVA